jgi:predicted amidohydrolase
MNAIKEKIRLCLVQSDIRPFDIKDNLNNYELLLETIVDGTDIIVFPEMFACGFSEEVVLIAEKYSALCFDFLHGISQRYHADVVASLPVQEKGRLYNRLVWIQGKNVIAQYDKRHLFFGCEKQFYEKGKTKTIVHKDGWNFLPLICYDIRFPNWCRNHYGNNVILYDCLLFIANFPVSRSDAFKSLLIARAIENQAYAIGLNRTGEDGFGNRHSGSSIVVDPLGEIIAEAPAHENYLLSVCIDMSMLTRLRKSFPVFQDWDEPS